MSSVRTEYASTVGQRTLPIGVAPVPGEALESWLATIAQRLDIAWCDLLGLVMPPAMNSPRRLFNLTTHLHPAESSAIAAATGAEQPTVEALTLARYNGTLLTIDRESHRVRSPWTPQRSRYCPLCLKRSGGRWQLSWRLPWVFVCDKHACLLADACPSCGQLQRVSPWWLSARMVPEPARCAMTREVDGLRVRCDGVLLAADTTPLARVHPISTAQARLFDVLSTKSTTFGAYHLMPTSSLQVLTDLRVLAARLLAVADTDNIDEMLGSRGSSSVREPFRQHCVGARTWTTPKGLATTAPALIAGIGIASALNVLGRTTLEDAALAFHPIIQHTRAAERTVTPASLKWGNLSSVMHAVQLKAFAESFTPTDELRYRTMTALPCYPSPVTAAVVRSIPTCLWRDWTLRLAVGRFRPEVMSPVLAMMVLCAGRQISAREAARFLNSDTSEEKWWRVVAGLHCHPLWPDIATAIVRVADFLTAHPSPIDYQRRRQLDYRNLLPADHWDAIYDRAVFGLIQSTRAAELTRSWLFERVSMQPAEVSPFAQNIHTPTRRRTEVVAKFTAEVMNKLDSAATDFLAENDICDEPVAWSPPPSIVADLELPGPDPRSVSITDLHEAVTGTHVPIETLARRFHVPTAVVRYLLEYSPPARPVAHRQTQLEYARTQLTSAALSRMYHQEGLPFRLIAARIGVRCDAISKLARQYGIEVRDPSKHRRPVIDPDWIYREYVVKQRTMGDLAREVGVDVSTMCRRARQHGIEVWRNPLERPRN
jgi:hypothetical protein